MKAKSGVYIQLQNIYKKKARESVADILQRVRATPGGEHVDPAEVELFCKNAAHVKLINATNGDAEANITKADRLKKVVGKWIPLPVVTRPPFASLSRQYFKKNGTLYIDICHRPGASE